MGLPAFDMSAFDAAQEAVAARPRVTTTIFTTAPFSAQVDVVELRENVRKSTDAIISSYESWRIKAVSGVANLRTLLNQATAHLPANELIELYDRNVEQLGNLKNNYDEYRDMDHNAILDAYSIIEAHSVLPSDIQRFFRREVRRVEKMAAERARVYERIIQSLTEIASRLDVFIKDNSLISAKELPADTLAVHFQSALQRAPDLDGAAERTARRLQSFPKTAAYLGR